MHADHAKLQSSGSFLTSHAESIAKKVEQLGRRQKIAFFIFRKIAAMAPNRVNTTGAARGPMVGSPAAKATTPQVAAKPAVPAPTTTPVPHNAAEVKPPITQNTGRIMDETGDRTAEFADTRTPIPSQHAAAMPTMAAGGVMAPPPQPPAAPMPTGPRIPKPDVQSPYPPSTAAALPNTMPAAPSPEEAKIDAQIAHLQKKQDIARGARGQGMDQMINAKLPGLFTGEVGAGQGLADYGQQMSDKYDQQIDALYKQKQILRNGAMPNTGRAAQLRAAYPGMEKTFPDRFHSMVMGNDPIPTRQAVLDAARPRIAALNNQAGNIERGFNDSMWGKLHNAFTGLTNASPDLMKEYYGDNALGKGLTMPFNNLQDMERHGWEGAAAANRGDLGDAAKHFGATAMKVAPWVGAGLGAGGTALLGRAGMSVPMLHTAGLAADTVPSFFGNTTGTAFNPTPGSDAYKIGPEREAAQNAQVAMNNHRATLPGMLHNDGTDMQALQRTGLFHPELFKDNPMNVADTFENPMLQWGVKNLAPSLLYPNVNMEPYMGNALPNADMMARLQQLAPFFLNRLSQ